MKPFNYVFSLIFMFFVQSAGAIPLTASDDAGYRGDSVVSALTDPSPVNLDSLWLDILFDENVVDFSGVSSSSLNIFTLDTANAATGMVFVGLSAPNTINSVSTELLQAAFTIRNGAPFGDTLVTFRCHDQGQGLGCFDYPFDPVTAKITVLRSAQIPLPATFWLLALGLPVLARARLRH